MDKTCMKCMNFKKESARNGIKAFEHPPMEKVSSIRGWRHIMHHKLKLCTVGTNKYKYMIYIYIHIYNGYDAYIYTDMIYIDISTCSRNANVYNIYVSLLLMIACVALRDSHTPWACELLYWDISPASNWMDEHSKLGSLKGNEQKTLYRCITY